jgi:hypothetical protein
VTAAHELGSQLPKLPFEIPKGQPGIGDTNRDQFYRFANEAGPLVGREWRKMPEMVRDVLQSVVDRKLLSSS